MAQEQFGLLALTNPMGALVAMALLTPLKAFSRDSSLMVF
jgi:hypothetical protein